jgi:hypothetical protein
LTLSGLTDGHLTFYQSSIKQELIKLVKLELKLAKIALNKHYCKSAAALGITMSIHHLDIDMAHSKDLIALVFEEDSATLLKHTEISTPQEFFDSIKTTTNNPEPPHQFPLLSAEHHSRVLPTAEPYRNLLLALFVCSWDNYLETQADQARQLTLKEFIETTLKETATALLQWKLTR